jgi:flavin-dependent dehydrogenase
MQVTVYAGGKTWIVDEAKLLNWLMANAIQAGAPKTVVREVIDDNETGRVLLNENKRD